MPSESGIESEGNQRIINKDQIINGKQQKKFSFLHSFSLGVNRLQEILYS